jgi:hypothetical protein
LWIITYFEQDLFTTNKKWVASFNNINLLEWKNFHWEMGKCL